MSRPKRPGRPRTLARQALRRADNLAQARSKLLDLELGGSAERPLEVPTAALVEPRARLLACPRCDQAMELLAHEAHTLSGRRLREAKVRCRSCGLARSLWFRISEPS